MEYEMTNIVSINIKKHREKMAMAYEMAGE